MKACRPSLTSGARVGLLASLAVMSSCKSTEDMTAPPPRVAVYATGGPSVDLNMVCYGSDRAQTCLSTFDVTGAFEVSDQPVVVTAQYLRYCGANPGLTVSWRNETAGVSGQAIIYPAQEVALGVCQIPCTCPSVPLQDGLNWIVITTTVTGEQPGQLHVPIVYSPAAK